MADSVDVIQRRLVNDVFSYAKDKKKAAGRALGTFVEIIAFYLLQSWGLRDHITIERPLPEFANPEITHNVEYCLHPILKRESKTVTVHALPLNARRLCEALKIPASEARRRNLTLLANGIVRNCCTLEDDPESIRLVHLDRHDQPRFILTDVSLHPRPFAIVECKRVGIEDKADGTPGKKGPQTIEKAKQGAYVARSVSALQKVRAQDGRVFGTIELDGKFRTEPYNKLLREAIASDDPRLLRGLILTIGVVSNHGNWFTSANQNKELKVLAHSYDWLLFLTDAGLAQFIEELLLEPNPVSRAFRASYGMTDGKKHKNRFTKVGMDIEADAALRLYFTKNSKAIKSWFNVIAPKDSTLDLLKKELEHLGTKNWARVHA